LLALGVVPVATTEWFGEKPGALFPWAKAKLGDAAVPEVLKDKDGIQLEKIAAHRPDLIIGLYSGITADDYKKLTAIAPTVAQPSGDPRSAGAGLVPGQGRHGQAEGRSALPEPQGPHRGPGRVRGGELRR
jgi:iron complex transport system substrate-binding protein